MSEIGRQSSISRLANVAKCPGYLGFGLLIAFFGAKADSSPGSRHPLTSRVSSGPQLNRQEIPPTGR